MDCHEFLARYSEYDDSRIPPSEAARFQAHLSECEACARYDRVLRKGRMVARQLRVEPSPDFVHRLDQRLWRESHRPALRRPARVAAGLAAVTILLAASASIGLMDAGPRGLEARVEQPPAAREEPARGTRPGATVVSLPSMGGTAPREWSARLAPAVRASYSPLVVGPPEYPRARPSSSAYSYD